MPHRSLLPLIYLKFLLLVAILACSDSPTSPDGDSQATFSRILHADDIGGQVSATDVVVTSYGRRVVSGGLSGTMHVTEWPDSLVSANANDLFVVAFDPDGSVAWARSVGGDGYELSYAITRDAGDNLYLGGWHDGTTVIGPSTLPGHGKWDAMVIKMDGVGNVLWAVGGGSAGEDVVHDVVATPSGDVFACGRAQGEFSIAGEEVGEGGSTSGFLVNIHSNGVGGWAATAYGTGNGHNTAVTRASDGDILVAGVYSGSTVEIGGEVLPVDVSDAYIARYTAGGAAIWASRIGGPGRMGPGRMTTIGDDLVIVGALSGTEDFNESAAGGEETSAGGNDAVIARYAADGSLKWVRRFGTAEDEFIGDVCRIGASGLFVMGIFTNSLTLGSKVLQSSGGRDCFIARLDGLGNVISASSMGGPFGEFMGAVASSGEFGIAIGLAGGSEFHFPDGTTRPVSGLDAFIYQQP